MFYSKKLSFILVLTSIQIAFCMESERPKKKQKIESSKEKITENLRKEKLLKEKTLNDKLSKLSLEDIKKWKEAKKFEGCLIACNANLFRYKAEKGLFNGIKYAFISKDTVECSKCDEQGYKINFFCKNEDKEEKLNLVLCAEKFNQTENPFFKARLLTIEEIKRILDLIKSKTYKFGDGGSLVTEPEILKLGNLLSDEKRKYLRKYLYNKSSSVKLILISIYKEKNSPFQILPMEIIVHIFRYIIEDEVRNYKNDSLLLEL